MDILTAKEVAGQLRCGLSTVYDLFDRGELKGFRLPSGGKRASVRIYATSVGELIARNVNQPPVDEKPQQESHPHPSLKAKRRVLHRKGQSFEDNVFVR